MRFVLLALLVLAAGDARADDVETPTGVIEGAAVDGVFEPLPGAEVRIVGDAIVMTVHATAWGGIRVRNLPPGRYRIEVAGGTFSQRSAEPPPPLQITSSPIHPPPPTSRYIDDRPRSCAAVMWENQRYVEAKVAALNKALDEEWWPFWMEMDSPMVVTRFRPRHGPPL